MDAVVFALLKKQLATKASLVDGKVPADELPSYVDDVIEYNDLAHFPTTGEEGKIYVAKDTGFTYRWSGSEYIQIGGQDLSSFVTLDTDQTIVGKKTFTGGFITNHIRPSSNNGIDLGSSTYQWKDIYVSGNLSDGTNTVSVTDIATEDYVDNKPNLIKITWSELKALRDNGRLIPGRFYRITDYICTTAQANTQSAGHVFDIIVRADSENKLNEEASAIQHEGDDYFANCDLQAWKLWYCLDNDSDKFLWADTANGKGVIYRMIDEFGNDCPYDFKNIQFKRCKITECQKSPSLAGRYLGISGIQDVFHCYTVDAADFIWCYTFTWINENNSVEDCSIVGQTLHDAEGLHQGVFSNKLERCGAYWAVFPETTESSATALNNIVIQATYEYENGNFYGICRNVFGNDCSHNTFGNICGDNTFGSKCCFNTAGNDYGSNIFGDFVMANTFGDECGENKLGNNMVLNAFGNICHLNTFGDMCQENTFGNSCDNNAFGNSCSSNTFSDYCRYNTFGDSCDNIAFGETCESNTFGNSCNNITFGDNCNKNSFGNYCTNNSFGSTCFGNTFGVGCSNNVFGSMCYSNAFGGGCSNNTFGGSCESNAFGDACSSNAFGNNCSNNVFGNECHDNVFGNYCQKNTFGNSCRNIIFGTRSDSTNTPADHYENNTVDNYCGFLCLKNASGAGQLQNIHIHSSVKGDSSAYKTIAVSFSLTDTIDVYPVGTIEMFI